MWHTRMATLPSLLLALSPFVILDSDNPDFMSALQVKDPSEYVMILGRNVEQDQLTRGVQE